MTGQWTHFETFEDAVSEFLKQYVSWKGRVSLVHGGGIAELYGGGEWAVVLEDDAGWPSKGDMFITHIQGHLDEMGNVEDDLLVVCKICGKDIDTICKETKRKKNE